MLVSLVWFAVTNALYAILLFLILCPSETMRYRIRPSRNHVPTATEIHHQLVRDEFLLDSTNARTKYFGLINLEFCFLILSKQKRTVVRTKFVGSEMYPSNSSSDDDDDKCSSRTSGTLQTICAKSMNEYLKNE